MRKIFYLILCVFLAACSKVDTEKIVPTRDQETFMMTVKIIPENKITDFCSNLGVSYHANGCASFNLDTKECTIYVIEPQHVDDTDKFAIVGHETWHCRFGKWHQ